MHWSYFWVLLKGLFVNPISPWLSIPSYLFGIILVLITIWPIIKSIFPETKEHMKKVISFVRNFRVHILVSLFIVSIIISSYSLYENKTPRFATPAELNAPVLSGLNIRATDLVPVYSEPIVTGKVFENCNFYGPAVWSIENNMVAEVGGSLSFVMEAGLTPDTAIISTLNKEWLGVIIFNGNVFKGTNKLHNISIITAGDKADQMRDELKKSLEQLGK
jgi:hypothetical protein